MYDSDPFWTLFLLSFLFGVTATIVIFGLWEAWRATGRRPASSASRAKVLPFPGSPRRPLSGSFGDRRARG